jgi:TetR/AcrR family transcriptional regulator
MRHFAERGYEDTRVQDIAADLGIAKGSIFQHFGSKEQLFLATYERAARSLPTYFDVPEEVLREGFFATLRYGLDLIENMIREDWVPSRVTLIGRWGTGLRIRREINRFFATEDPYRAREFVRFGMERGELRGDLDIDLVIALLDWVLERTQDALVKEELDPGIFRPIGGSREWAQMRIDQFVELFRTAVAVQPAIGGGEQASARAPQHDQPAYRPRAS